MSAGNQPVPARKDGGKPCALEQQAARGTRLVSALRRRARHPGTWLAVFGLLLLLGLLDSLRPPERQVTARLYTGTVGLYRTVRGEWLGKYVTCRYLPTCSHFSQEAVRTHGIRYGLLLTARRLVRCKSDVRPGSPDPVPAND